MAKVRGLLGPTDFSKAEKGKVRGDDGTDMMVNVVVPRGTEEEAVCRAAAV